MYGEGLGYAFFQVTAQIARFLVVLVCTVVQVTAALVTYVVRCLRRRRAAGQAGAAWQAPPGWHPLPEFRPGEGHAKGPHGGGPSGAGPGRGDAGA